MNDVVCLLWKQHLADPVPFHTAGEKIAGIPLVQLVGKIDEIVSAFFEAPKVPERTVPYRRTLELRTLENCHQDLLSILAVAEGEQKNYFVRLHLILSNRAKIIRYFAFG